MQNVSKDRYPYEISAIKVKNAETVDKFTSNLSDDISEVLKKIILFIGENPVIAFDGKGCSCSRCRAWQW